MPDLPDVRIEINGKQMSGITDDLLSLSVQEDLGAVSMFAIEVANWNQDNLTITWSDDRAVAPGATVRIWLGYVDKLTKVFYGEITSLEPSFVTGEPPRLVIRGFDLAHRLQRSRNTRTFAKQKDSDIVKAVARGSGLKVEAKDSKLTLELVTQHNQTDWDFLIERARRVGYLLVVRDDTLRFGPLELTGPLKDTLYLNDGVRSFHARLSARLLSDRRTVNGWNVKEKKVITGKAGTEVAVGQGTRSLAQAARAFGHATTVVADAGIAAAAEAEGMATGQQQAESMLAVTGELVCQGRPALHAGDLVEVAEAGTRFSGRYLVTGVTHTLDNARGYRTRLLLGRNTG